MLNFTYQPHLFPDLEIEMYRSMGVSVSSLVPAMAAVVHTDDWFRLNRSEIVPFTGNGPSEGGGVAPINILVDGGADPQISRRVYGALNIPVWLAPIGTASTSGVIDER